MRLKLRKTILLMALAAVMVFGSAMSCFAVAEKTSTWENDDKSSGKIEISVNGDELSRFAYVGSSCCDHGYYAENSRKAMNAILKYGNLDYGIYARGTTYYKYGDVLINSSEGTIKAGTILNSPVMKGYSCGHAVQLDMANWLCKNLENNKYDLLFLQYDAEYLSGRGVHCYAYTSEEKKKYVEVAKLLLPYYEAGKVAAFTESGNASSIAYNSKVSDYSDFAFSDEKANRYEKYTSVNTFYAMALTDPKSFLEQVDDDGVIKDTDNLYPEKAYNFTQKCVKYNRGDDMAKFVDSLLTYDTVVIKDVVADGLDITSVKLLGKDDDGEWKEFSDKATISVNGQEVNANYNSVVHSGDVKLVIEFECNEKSFTQDNGKARETNVGDAVVQYKKGGTLISSDSMTSPKLQKEIVISIDDVDATLMSNDAKQSLNDVSDLIELMNPKINFSDGSTTTQGIKVSCGDFDKASSGVPGEYTVTFSYNTDVGDTIFLNKTLTIIDKKPEININNTSVSKGTSLAYALVDAGMSATDEEDGNLTNEVTVANDGGYDPNTPGSYTVTLEVTDSHGNKATKAVEITVLNNPPVIEGKDIEVRRGTSLDDVVEAIGVRATDDEGDDLTNEVTVADDGGYDSNKPGTYTVTFEVTDSHGNKTTNTFEVAVYDNPPIIQGTYANVYRGTSIEDAVKAIGVMATDEEDGDLTENITVADDGGYDPNTPGTYMLTLEVTDSVGNKATKIFEVNVKRNPPTIDANDISIEKETSLDDAVKAIGARATDDECNDLSDAIALLDDGGYDPNTPGTYMLTLEVTDSDGNTSTKVVTVDVVDDDDDVAPLHSDNPNGDNPNSDNPHTGDDNGILVYIVTMLLGGGGVVGICRRRKKMQ